MAEVVDDRYELVDVVASGGMATVWRARDTRLGRVVALKRPHPAPPGDPAHRRIEEEARVAAGISHPNLVTVLDTGHDEHGPYVVMEYLPGPTLAQTDTPMPTAEAVQVGTALAHALAAVHQAGVVHRDVKPANVILSDNGPKLTDFGIAMREDLTRRLTSTGQVVATPAYAAPEVLAGEDPTPAADVFALGALLYELVTGSPAFEGADRTSLPDGVPDPHLDRVIASALAPEPEARPSAAELAQALEGGAPTVVMGPTPSSAGETLTMEAAPGRSRRGWWAPVLVALAAIGLAAAALNLAGDGDPAGASDTTVSENPSSTTIPATTAPATVPATTTPPTTNPPPPTTSPIDPVDEALNGLEDALDDAHPSELSPPERRHLEGDIERLRRAVAEGDGVERAFESLAEEVADIGNDRVRDQAWPLVEELAALLGIEPGDDEKGDGKDKDKGKDED